MTVIREITTDQFLSSLQKFDYVSFQQTPFWAEARRVDWPEFASVGWYADGPDPISVAIIRYRRIPGTTKRFAFIPYGPLIDWDNADIGEQLAALRTYLEAQNVIGVRMLPYISLHRWDNATVRAGLREPTARHFRDLAPDRTNPTALRLKAIMRDSGWIEKSVPQETRIDYGLFNFRLDLEDRTEDDVLAGMHKTWRYNAKEGFTRRRRDRFGNHLRGRRFSTSVHFDRRQKRLPNPVHRLLQNYVDPPRPRAARPLHHALRPA
jgi:hypothetical protein